MKLKYSIALWVCLTVLISAKNNPITLPSTVKKEIFSHVKKHHFTFQATDKTKRKVTHKILMHKKINDSLYVLSGSFRKKYECHVCGVKLSLFVYKKTTNTWKLHNKIIDFEEHGSWGVAPAKRNLDIVQIGKNAYALKIIGGGGGQGYFITSVNLYHIMPQHINHLGWFQTHNDDGGTGNEPPKDNWDATFSILPSNKAFYTIKMHKKGLEEGKKVNAVHRYEYSHEKNEYWIGKSTKKPMVDTVVQNHKVKKHKNKSIYTIGTKETCSLVFDKRQKLIKSNCQTQTNSKGIRIYCNKSKKVCKTHQEILEAIQ